MKLFRHRQRGFGFIEILVTMGVLAVGILGVATLNGVITRTSADNKTRAEALSIAQSRLEEMRNYTNSAASLTEFNTLYADVTDGNSTAIAGVNAAFTRTETITTSGSRKEVVVEVAWTDAEGAGQDVGLNGELLYVPPRSVGDTALEAGASLVDAPTGRARLGEGELPEGATTTDNGDGTSLYEDDSDDLMLVFEDQIVLTLALACQTEDGTCLDFVKIKGTVYIDTANQNIDPGDVAVIASDAAFCARYYHDASNNLVKVTYATTSALTTANGDYEYFHYTCYLGGGWHGNVGLLLAGGIGSRDKICVGDPTSANAWEEPVMASRRAYRGMLYKIDLAEDDGKEKIAGTNLTRYYSQGVADQTELPVPASGDAGHDFVLTDLNPNNADSDSCIDDGIMVRSDSNVNGTAGDLFAGVPTDWVCLNDGLLDSYDTAVFGHETSCPYDPTDPPTDKWEISGGLRVTADETTANADIVAAVGLVTSDGPGNCRISYGGVFDVWNYQGSYYETNYSCDVFDWGSGWSGYVEMVYTGMTCTSDSFTKTNLAANSSSNNLYDCSISTSADSHIIFSGVVDLDSSNNRELSSVSLSDGGTCSLATDGLSYSCQTAGFTGSWTGSITFNADANVCTGTGTGSNPASFSYTSQAAGNISLDVMLKSNAGQCP